MCLQLVLLSLLICWSAAQQVGAPCSNPDGTTGECKIMLNCPEGLKILRTAGKHKLHRCGFEGVEEVVCCPSGGETTTTISNNSNENLNPRGKPNTRKAAMACESYVKTSTAKVQWNIINGVDALEGEFPHMCALGYQGDGSSLKWLCGGTLIAPKYVLTAAHCVIKADEIEPSKVRIGTVDLTNETNPHKQDLDVDSNLVHPDYHISAKVNDLAILKLKQPAQFTKWVQPACLYTKTSLPRAMMVTGWGIINLEKDESSNNALQKAPIYETNVGQCIELYRSRNNKVINNRQICAADVNVTDSADTCQGDSGGPLQVENLQDSSLFSVVGVTSYGMGCGTKHPSIYARVSEYLDFIENYVWPD